MNANTYLLFDGTCAEAMKFYEETLKGTLQVMTVKDAPVPAQCGNPDDVLHAYLQFDGGALMASDWMMPNAPFPGQSGFHVALNVKDASEAKRLFETLSANGSVGVPLQQTFFAEAFGMCVDRFGTPWIVNGGARS